MTLLSVIVPLRGMAGRLGNLKTWLDEVGSNPIEIVIIHDIQDEETELELKELCKEFTNLRITVITKRLDSPGLARNLGIEIATGKYISFWDSDDLPNVEVVVNDLATLEEDVDLVIGQFETVDSGRVEVARFKSKDSTLIETAFNPGLWRMAFKTETLGGIRFSKYKMGEDQEFLAQVLTKMGTIVFSEKIWYRYFMNNAEQLTMSKHAIIDLQKIIPRASLHQRNTSSEILLVLMIMQLRKITSLAKYYPVTGLISFLQYFVDSCKFGGIHILPTFVKSLGYSLANLSRTRL